MQVVELHIWSKWKDTYWKLGLIQKVGLFAKTLALYPTYTAWIIRLLQESSFSKRLL